MSTETPFDPGLQPERTYLAWQRTVLALAVACAVSVRFTADRFGVPAIVLGIGGIGLALAAYIATYRGYRRTHRALTDTAQLHGRGAWRLALLAASTLFLGGLAVLFLWGNIRIPL
ncbi:DUF202 domain-containing protein [Glaciibacter psychrotolerans]|uniref:Uncharacterized membrane protein YidH (DUF202 family) n=1 Tax=Glaciibacter psychrotolerans TaxID=670054 RepID=A0A7Z0J669_9MICO|nr:DUF202 domain-containing protein [Leifsonia psychrotolerans]NYJ19911.1 uncharacterized membrane protein YidH (DUF202 family) [Leifsonia psychrotolerans]